MSSSKLDKSGVFETRPVQARETELSLSPSAVRVHKNGLEFKSLKALPLWKEMTVSLTCATDQRKTNLTGVVVACNGNKHTGYMVSMVILNMTRQTQERLSTMAASHRA